MRHSSAICAVLLAVLAAGCQPQQSATSSSVDVTAAPEATAPQASEQRSAASRPASSAATRTSTSAAFAPNRAPARVTALRALGGLRTGRWLSHSGYARSQFGRAWIDVDSNGCGTRDDILNRDLRRVTKSGWCVVTSGVLKDPYTAQSIYFVRGGASEVDIDHVVALSNAWQTGAANWPYAKRVALANDPANLLAVDSSANRQKGDADASEWLPRNGFQCAYVARQVMIKRKYRLFVTAAEKSAMKRVLSRCPSTALPSPGSNPTVAANAGSAPSGGGTSGGNVIPPPHTGVDPRFSTCKAAKAAGYGPYLSGRDVEYGWYRDGDSDGVVCE